MIENRRSRWIRWLTLWKLLVSGTVPECSTINIIMLSYMLTAAPKWQEAIIAKLQSYASDIEIVCCSGGIHLIGPVCFPLRISYIRSSLFNIWILSLPVTMTVSCDMQYYHILCWHTVYDFCRSISHWSICRYLNYDRVCFDNI